MKKIFEVALGIVTSIGGYLDVGTLATTIAAGAVFGFRLIWVVVLGTICVIFLVEMSGRLAACSHHTVRGAMRERLGFPFFVSTMIIEMFVDLLVLAAEIGGVCFALQLLTGVGIRVWALPVALLTWLLLWKGTFGIIEKGTALLGLIALAFLLSAHRLHPPLGAVLHGLIPTSPPDDASHYWFLAVSILGSLISPYLLYFYSSGAIEDKWTTKDLSINRIVASTGMGFGSIVTIGVLVTAAMVFKPHGVRIEQYDQAAVMLSSTLGHYGYYVFACALAITCLGAALEVSLTLAYGTAQGLGWKWGEDVPPKEAARFTATYTIGILIAAIPMLLGIDPLQLTMFSMALTALALPFVIVPFLVIMNDETYLGPHRNHHISNLVVGGIIVLAFVMALVSIPLEIMGGG